MRKKTIAMMVAAATIVLLFPAQRMSANPAYVTYYAVRYNCILGISGVYGMLVGEWTEECDGSMNGWGWEPGHNCTYTDVTYGDYCGGGGPPCPECGPENQN